MKGYTFTPVRIVFWVLMASILGVVASFWIFGRPGYHRSIDKPQCIMNQRNLQQVVRRQQQELNLKPGDPIDWSKLFGPGLQLEKRPLCPVHGEYPYSPVVTELGTLVAPCQDPNHRPLNTKDW